MFECLKKLLCPGSSSPAPEKPKLPKVLKRPSPNTQVFDSPSTFAIDEVVDVRDVQLMSFETYSHRPCNKFTASLYDDHPNFRTMVYVNIDDPQVSEKGMKPGKYRLTMTLTPITEEKKS